MTELERLRSLSARVGADPLLVQAAGGNTSLKQDGVLWIKASGTWLKDAIGRDIFVPVQLDDMLKGLSEQDPRCETCVEFVRKDLNTDSLRPSIETTVHGLMPQKVVLHVHCVNTIAHAIQEDAETILLQKLKGFDWAFVPYARPGLPLARAISARLRAETDVLVLGNHGLVVAADSVAEAEQLLEKVCMVLELPAIHSPVPKKVELEKVAAGTDYVPANDGEVHALAMAPDVLSRGRDKVFYPDHVVFLGDGVATNFFNSPPLVALEGVGTLVHRQAKTAVEAMGRCLADVLRRIPSGTALRALSSADLYALTHWEAEKYRQKI